ncbi:MAG: hypothetical protein ACJ0OS_02815 [Candidatus Marisimplicoccus sp.]|tara:strand:- start:57 stop:440 length:384 start_codon:yes stop_codon:yes gene_type:complete
MKKLLLILFSTSLISCLSVNLSIDDEAAKSIADAINKSNSKIHMMRLHKDGPISMKSDEKMKKVMIRGERFGKGPNANRYMDELPKVIIDRVKRASEKGIDIKIDTIIISEDGERKEIKIEVKAGNN